MLSITLIPDFDLIPGKSPRLMATAKSMWQNPRFQCSMGVDGGSHV